MMAEVEPFGLFIIRRAQTNHGAGYKDNNSSRNSRPDGHADDTGHLYHRLRTCGYPFRKAGGTCAKIGEEGDQDEGLRLVNEAVEVWAAADPEYIHLKAATAILEST